MKCGRRNSALFRAAPAILLAAVSGAAVPRAALAGGGCPDLLIVLDRSGSMAKCSIEGATKEAIAKKALKGLIADFPGLSMGIVVFPDTLTTCDPGYCTGGKVQVDVAMDGGPKVAKVLDGMSESCGGTPTGATMQNVKEYTKWTSDRRYVLLLTDGQPTCDDGDNGGTPEGMNMCTMGMPGVPCDGDGFCECTNPTKVFDAITDLLGKGIHTFVVGFAGMGSGDGCTGMGGGMPFNPDTLNQMAMLGGEPNPGATKYYSATDGATLREALKNIAGKVGGGTVGTCAGGGGSGGAAGGADGGFGGGGGSGGQGAQSGQGGNPGDPPPGAGHKPAAACLCNTLPFQRGAFGAHAVVLVASGLAVLRGRSRRRRIARTEAHAD